MNNASESAATAMTTPRSDASVFSPKHCGMNQEPDLSEDEDFHCKPPVRYPLLVVAGAVFLAVLFLCGLFAEQLAPAGYAAQDLAARLSPPVWLGGKSGLLGTDFLGRDILSRLLYAIRISLLVAFAGTLISCTLGTTLGFLAAHKKGWVDEFIMMLIDFQASMPFVLIALAILAFLGNSLGLFIAVMGLNGWERFARFTRGLARSASARGYVNAVRVMGASPPTSSACSSCSLRSTSQAPYCWNPPSAFSVWAYSPRSPVWAPCSAKAATISSTHGGYPSRPEPSSSA